MVPNVPTDGANVPTIGTNVPTSGTAERSRARRGGVDGFLVVARAGHGRR